MNAPILFYDGVCRFCDASVRFVLRHERQPRMCFMALQAREAASLLAPHGIASDDLSSMLVLDGDRLLRESDAAIFLARGLRQPWRLLGTSLRFIPRRLRDAAYRSIGRRRYQWWGRSTRCIPVPPEHRHRFLDSLS